MPTYDYQCQACGHRFELFQSMTARVKRKCPECGKSALERLIGPGAGFLFKGDGFYITDYRSDSYKAGEKAAEDKPVASDSKTGSGGDGKSSKSSSSSDSGKSKSAGKSENSGKPKKSS